jgi:hypothetical protein
MFLTATNAKFLSNFLYYEVERESIFIYKYDNIVLSILNFHKKKKVYLTMWGEKTTFLSFISM